MKEEAPCRRRQGIEPWRTATTKSRLMHGLLDHKRDRVQHYGADADYDDYYRWKANFRQTGSGPRYLPPIRCRLPRPNWRP